LTLPWVIRKVKPEDNSNRLSERKQETIIQKKLAEASRKVLLEKYADKIDGNDHLKNMSTRLDAELKYFIAKYEAEVEPDGNDTMTEQQLISLEILEQQRQILYQVNHKMEFDEEVVRKYLALLDLEETKLREKLPEHYR
jgi:CPA1 family monovalent cation:H+ antiporter